MCKCHKGKEPRECSPEQIKECHGDVDRHPCEEDMNCEKDIEAEKKSDK